MSYFTDRHGGARPRTVEHISDTVAAAIVVMMRTRATDGSFAQSYPTPCGQYSSAIVETNEDDLRAAIHGLFPELAWPLVSVALVGNYRALDLVEFTFEKVAQPMSRDDDRRQRYSRSPLTLGDGRSVARRCASVARGGPGSPS